MDSKQKQKNLWVDPELENVFFLVLNDHLTLHFFGLDKKSYFPEEFNFFECRYLPYLRQESQIWFQISIPLGTFNFWLHIMKLILDPILLSLD